MSHYRVDPTANTATSTNYHNRLPPLRIAIKFGFMQIWKMIRDQMELTEEAKLDQLYFMLEERQIESPTVPPLKEFKELLLSLPMELVGRANFQMRDLCHRLVELHFLENGACWTWPSIATKLRLFAFFWIRGL